MWGRTLRGGPFRAFPSPGHRFLHCESGWRYRSCAQREDLPKGYSPNIGIANSARNAILVLGRPDSRPGPGCCGLCPARVALVPTLWVARVGTTKRPWRRCRRPDDWVAWPLVIRAGKYALWQSENAYAARRCSAESARRRSVLNVNNRLGGSGSLWMTIERRIPITMPDRSPSRPACPRRLSSRILVAVQPRRRCAPIWKTAPGVLAAASTAWRWVCIAGDAPLPSVTRCGRRCKRRSTRKRISRRNMSALRPIVATAGRRTSVPFGTDTNSKPFACTVRGCGEMS